MAKAKAPARGAGVGVTQAPSTTTTTPQPPLSSAQTTTPSANNQGQPAPEPHSAPNDSAASLDAAAKKKKKKGKAKRIEDDYDVADAMSPAPPSVHGANAYSQPHLSPAATAQAQAQADLLATASDLYRRIEADPQGIPDDDAYWTSLPAHLRTFIRNALPLGQFPTTGNGHPHDPSARHASTQAMIAVAQQLAQAAHASQRHLQQYPPGSQPYPSLPFDPAIFADLALHSDPGATMHSHAHHANGINATQSPYVHYSAAGGNPPPSQPPGEPLPAPVVLVNEYGEETGDYDDEYYSEDELDDPNGGLHDGYDRRDGSWPAHDQAQRNAAAAAMINAPPSKKKNKKKKKKSGTGATAMPPPPTGGGNDPSTNPLPATLPPAATLGKQSAPPTTVPPPPRTTQQPPPSSRAAGKQPMTFNSNASGKAAATNAPNGHAHHHATGKRSAAGGAGSVSSHGTGGQGGQAGAAPSGQPPRIWSTSTAEERERIKEFWMGLNDKDRRQLVQVEKDAVLKRMKEVQKHSCSCAVCGRKRTSIESELEVLYNAYFDELQQYASQQQQYVKSGGALPPPPGPGPFPGSITLDSAGNVVGGNALSSKALPPNQKTRVTAPPKKAVAPPPPPPEDDDGYDDELDDDDYDDDYDDEEEEEEDDMMPDAAPLSRKRGVSGGHAPGTNDAFPLGSSLTVKGALLKKLLFALCRFHGPIKLRD